ncbi:unannotated protein [freshwater metagenome]|uniref:Unannotated protein n=1 Tax=freshwater metagenome TaxID=449393 RepID=A0A6J7BCB2_9ZZZZ
MGGLVEKIVVFFKVFKSTSINLEITVALPPNA